MNKSEPSYPCAPPYPKRAVPSLSTLSAAANVTRLYNAANHAEVYLVGTRYFHKESADQVQELIQSVRPNIVAVELCKERIGGSLPKDSGKKQPRFGLIQRFFKCRGSIKEKLIYLACYAKCKKVEKVAGRESFVAAIEEATKIGAELFLIDETFEVTLARASRALSISNIFNSIKKVIERELPFPKLGNANPDSLEGRKAVSSLVDAVRSVFPELVDAGVDKRDETMTKRLLRCKGKVVAVVGLGHMDGIEARWNAYQSDKEKLQAVTNDSSVVRVVYEETSLAV